MKQQCKQYPEKRVSPEPQKSPHVTFCLLPSPQGNHLSRLLIPQTHFAGFKILRRNLKGCALLCQASFTSHHVCESLSCHYIQLQFTHSQYSVFLVLIYHALFIYFLLMGFWVVSSFWLYLLQIVCSFVSVIIKASKMLSCPLPLLKTFFGQDEERGT